MPEPKIMEVPQPESHLRQPEPARRRFGRTKRRSELVVQKPHPRMLGAKLDGNPTTSTGSITEKSFKEEQWYLGTHAEFVGNEPEGIQPDWAEREGFVCRSKKLDDGAKLFWIDDGEGGEMLRVMRQNVAGTVELFGKPKTVANETESLFESVSAISNAGEYDEYEVGDSQEDETEVVLLESPADIVSEFSGELDRVPRSRRGWWRRALVSLRGCVKR